MDITMTTRNTLKIITFLLIGCCCLTQSVPVLKFSGQISLEGDEESGLALPWILMSKMIDSDRPMNIDTDNSSEYYSGEQNDVGDIAKRGNGRSDLMRYLYSGKIGKAASTMGRQPGRR
ncbi:uncharacterized protein [Antedon mediterranea]|uniref:uncharacterized protein n=1 Tax=Antedon mediterranea TaxID=105859 RepID=UPI003AF43944